MHTFSNLPNSPAPACCRKNKMEPEIDFLESLIYTTFSFALFAASCIMNNSTGAFVSGTALVICISHAYTLKTILDNDHVMEPDSDNSDEDDDDDEDDDED